MLRAFLVTLSSVFVIAACGGGGSSTPPPPASPPPPPPATGLVVSAANAKPAVRVAYASTMQSTDTGGLVGGSGIATTGNSGFQKPGKYTPGTGGLPGLIASIPLGPDTYACGVSGTQTISGDLASLFTLTVGDQINVEAANCDDGLGEVVNGRMEMTVATFSGDLALGLYLLEMDVLLIDFQVTTATVSVISNGDSTVSIDTTGNPVVTMGISGSSMTTVANTVTTTMTDFDTSQTVDASVMPEPYTLSSSGTINNSDLAGMISYTTPVTFQGMGADYPFAGELLVTGANNASIRLIALDSVNVRIETDTDGNGTVDSTEDTTWDDIAATL